MAKGIRDLLLFFAFAGVPIASFLLQDFPDTQFFAILLVIFLPVLIWLRQYHEEKEQIVDYDENLSFESLLWTGGCILATYVVASFIVNTFAVSSIYVPFKGLTMMYGSFELSGIWNDFLFNIVLVAPAEELCKLVLHLAFFMKLKSVLGVTLAKVLSIALPIGFWSILHAYKAYTGPNMATLLASAFVGGLLFFGVMYKTKSFLAAVLSHAGYNSLIIYLIYVGGMLV